MSAALPVPRKFSRRTDFIWLGETDPEGRPLDPRIKEVAYQKQVDLARYRADEMTDEAVVASLIEQAVYATSKIASERDLNDPAGYLFRTYTNLVDTTLRRTVEAFGLEGMSPSWLGRHDWNSHTLQAGQKVSIDYYPLRDGRPGGFFVRVTMPDGKTIAALPGGPGRGPPPPSAASGK